MSAPEDLSLKVLQLECIIDAKDRELQILRDQASLDQQELVEVLQAENKQLKSQLEQAAAQAHGISATAATSGLPSAVEQTAVSAAVALQQSSAALQRLLSALQSSHLAGQSDAAAATADASNTTSTTATADRLVQLNVSGKHMEVPVSVLQIPGSRLADMFTPDSSQQPLRDAAGRFYLPFEPSAFKQIITALQARHLFGSQCSQPLTPPPPPSSPLQQQQLHDRMAWAYLRELVNYLGLQVLLTSPAKSTSSSGSAAAINGLASRVPSASWGDGVATAAQDDDVAAAAATAAAAVKAQSAATQALQIMPEQSESPSAFGHRNSSAAGTDNRPMSSASKGNNTAASRAAAAAVAAAAGSSRCNGVGGSSSSNSGMNVIGANAVTFAALKGLMPPPQRKS